jgi:CBS domain containing-hemolysin-like protein
MVDLATRVVLLALLIAGSAFFGGIEVALVKVSRAKIKKFLEESRKGAEALKRLKDNPNRMITTIMVGNNLVNVFASAVATEIAIEIFGSLGVGIATGVMTFIILVFGEITPKNYCLAHADTLSLRFARAIEIIGYILYPFVIAFEYISKGLLMTIGEKEGKEVVSEEELIAMVDIGVEDKVLDKEEGKLIESLLKFNDISVRAVMTPRVRMFVLDADMTLKDALPLINRMGFSRIPIIEGSKDKIVGIVHARDVLKALENGKNSIRLRNIARKPLFVSQEKKISSLLKEMNSKRTHMAIVVDEFGGTEGLVTLEDLLEEIVGEIMDEKDVSPQNIAKVGKDCIVVHGDTEIDDVNEYLKIALPKGEDYSTISGLLHDKLEDIPKKGDVLEFSNAVLYVEEVVSNTPVRVRIVKKEKKNERSLEVASKEKKE